MRRNEAARPAERLRGFEANTLSPVPDPCRSPRQCREVRQPRIGEPPFGPVRRRDVRIAYVDGRGREDIAVVADILDDKDVGRPTVPPGSRSNDPIGTLFLPTR